MRNYMKGKKDIPIYIVTAYNYGKRTGDSYLVGVFTDEKIAVKEAIVEEKFRGIKYSCEIVEINLNHVLDPYKNIKIIYQLDKKILF